MADQGTRSGSSAVRFLLDGRMVALRDVDPTRTVLQYLREDLRRTGTKEGCAEGDCGACTVVLAELDERGERLRFRAINSCIQFLPTLDGKELITVESLAGRDGELHPVQHAMVECHGSQCGFCTPGFVMSLFALYKSDHRPGRRAIDDALAGNLCRCTGYRPIVDAASRMYDHAVEDERGDQNWMHCSFSSATATHPQPGEQEAVELLRSLARHDRLELEHDTRRYFAPSSLEDLAHLAKAHPQARLLAGGTDVGLWVTKHQRVLDTVIYVGNVREMKRVELDETHLELGAAVTLTGAAEALVAHYPELDELFRRFASPPIRNAGTLGGNIANGSPIGDSMPVLIALGTTLVLRDGEGRRELALEDFYLDYQRTALTGGEFVEAIRVPLPAAGARLRTYKISKRFDQDISAVCAAFRIVLDGTRITDARVAFGGMAATPRRATACENALVGEQWCETTLHAAMTALDRDYAPISDMRASAAYRHRVARNLLHKFYLETSGQSEGSDVPASVYDYGR